MSKVRKLLSASRDEEEWHVLLNVYLVAQNVRCACLVESVGLTSDFYYKLKKGLSHDTQIRTSESKTNRPRLLVYNKNCVTNAEAHAAHENDELMGRLLEFVCPGEQTTESHYEITIWAEDPAFPFSDHLVELRSEMCPITSLTPYKRTILQHRLQDYETCLWIIFPNVSLSLQVKPKWGYTKLIQFLEAFHLGKRKTLPKSARVEIANVFYVGFPRSRKIDTVRPKCH